MASYKMVLVAVVLALAWAGVASVCISSIATAPANLVAISGQRSPPPPVAAPEVQEESPAVAAR